VNEITGDYYYGAHSTNNLFDGYQGSGILIKRAVKHYGKENFNMQIIQNCVSSASKWKWERKIVTYKIINDPKCYNLVTGGRRKSKNTRKVKITSKADRNLWDGCDKSKWNRVNKNN